MMSSSGEAAMKDEGRNQVEAVNEQWRSRRKKRCSVPPQSTPPFFNGMSGHGWHFGGMVGKDPMEGGRGVSLL